MSDQDIFNQEQKTEIPSGTTAAPNTNPFADKLTGIVDEAGKPKYDSVEKALDALAHSQTFIGTLKSESSTKDAEIIKLREELEKRSTVEDFVNKLAPAKPEVNPQETPKVDAGMDEAKIAEIVRNTLTQNQQEAFKASNVKSVVSTLETKYGETAAQEVANKAKELGMTTAELQTMASERPQLVLSLFGEKNKPSQSTVSSNSGVVSNPEESVSKINIMKGGATSADLRSAWNSVGKGVKEKWDVKS